MKKMRKNAGFTLVEMLIVVAIIAILIAVSIPMVNSSLEKARKATDEANERAAKAEASILFLNDDPSIDGNVDVQSPCVYVAETGTLTNNTGYYEDDEGYGKCTADGHAGGHIVLQMNPTGQFVTFEWADCEKEGTAHNTYAGASVDDTEEEEEEGPGDDELGS